MCSRDFISGFAGNETDRVAIVDARGMAQNLAGRNKIKFINTIEYDNVYMHDNAVHWQLRVY